MKVDAIRIIEAGYNQAATDEQWLSPIVDAFEPVTRGMGAMAGIVDFEGAGARVGNWVGRDRMPDWLPAAWQGMYAYLGEHHPEALRAILSPNPSVVCWSSERSSCIPPVALEPIRALFREWPVFKDCLGVLSAEPVGPSILVSVPYQDDVAIPPRTRWQLARATAHLCAAIRLRRRASAAPARSDGLAPDVEAVLDPAGKVHDAQGVAESRDARASLGAIVRRVERARGRLRHADPEQALDIWLALFDGRWSVVEHVESDGRRFLLARRNAPGARDPMAVTQGERDVLACVARGHSNKYTAYLLGIATSTVATRLESALRKLGLASRREAIEMLARS
ncbi:MAG TPA: LuxR C-terminal-related transcriptional regulator [Anaeromyxobacteraceae bacterium]|nr:LuxR C-terminal-related transcriptional regulator [Anaeromyxobacteraceae bacterium]